MRRETSSVSFLMCLFCVRSELLKRATLARRAVRRGSQSPGLRFLRQRVLTRLDGMRLSAWEAGHAPARRGGRFGAPAMDAAAPRT
jgi:hypothetical protein